mmetsp:Transcript_9628/g.20862  ORF Transcript_9628/g.20862 Transcript_9628/m.20862 type:complete len:222 (+) Transcript_9628:495-1160(+)
MHRGQLFRGRIGNVDVQALTLADKGRTIGSQIENDSLRNLPDGLVNIAEFFWNFFNLLHGSTVGDEPVADRLVPNAKFGQITQQVFVDNRKLSCQDTSVVDIGGERFCALVVPQNLGGRCRGHGSYQKRVSQSVLGNICLEFGPVPTVAWSDTPQVELEFSLAHRRSGITLVVSFFLGKITTGRAGTKVNGLKNISIQLGCLGRVKGKLEHGKGIRQSLHS